MDVTAGFRGNRRFYGLTSRRGNRRDFRHKPPKDDTCTSRCFKKTAFRHKQKKDKRKKKNEKYLNQQTKQKRKKIVLYLYLTASKKHMETDG